MDVAYYHQTYGDLADAFKGNVNSLVYHYVNAGKSEGRTISDSSWIRTAQNISKIGDYYVTFRSVSNSGLTSSASNYTHLNIVKEITFDYTGGEQVYTIPYNGTYRLEVWGAQGGNISTYIGGFGGYSTGRVTLNKSSKLYINVGGTTSNNVGGYNGGGSNTPAQFQAGFGIAGGGATHIAKNSGLLYTLENNKSSILIVAGGGGGANHRGEEYGDGNGGSGGGYIGNPGASINYSNGYGHGYGLGGTQTSGGGHNWITGWGGVGNVEAGLFGRAAITQDTSVIQSGGGGGYYGGGNGGHGGAGGGSGYIGNTSLFNKGMYCYNCASSTDTNTKTTSTSCNSSTPTVNCAKQGNGYAKITILSTSS